MKQANGNKLIGRALSLFVGVFLLFGNIIFAHADVTFNILAVNGSEKPDEKEIKEFLPKELNVEDILDAAGLRLDYDVTSGAYFVEGKVNLGPKETKTLKIRFRDVWQVDPSAIQDIATQIDASLERIEGTEYYEVGKIKKDSLLKQLDYIVNEQAKFADNVERRIDRHRLYSQELEKIRSNALSVHYWRSRPPTAEEAGVVTLVVEVENPSERDEKKVEPKHYLPREVRPEHLVDAQGFETRYDVTRGQSYLTKEEILKPSEKKRYTILILDIWKIPQADIDDLKDRTRKAYKLLQETEYKESAEYLVASILENLQLIEDSQGIERDINEHISAFRANQGRFEAAEKDVKALEELLQAVRESLERSRLKNVLQKIKKFKTIADIAEAVIGVKPSVNNAWKIITGIVIFVGIYTFLHFTIWGKRSRELEVKRREEEAKKPDEENEENKEES